MAKLRTIGNRLAPTRFLVFFVMLGATIAAATLIAPWWRSVLWGFDLSAVTFVLAALAGSAFAAPVNYKTPDEVAAFKPGPNLEVVQGNCSACHSADYVNTQPPMKDKKGFWQAEVTKMIKVYGAPIDDADVGKIVDYLAATY